MRGLTDEAAAAEAARMGRSCGAGGTRELIGSRGGWLLLLIRGDREMNCQCSLGSSDERRISAAADRIFGFSFSRENMNMKRWTGKRERRV